jgi:hypothetical protein
MPKLAAVTLFRSRGATWTGSPSTSVSKASPANGVGFSSSAHPGRVEKSRQAATYAVLSSKCLSLVRVMAARRCLQTESMFSAFTTLRQGDTREGPSVERAEELQIHSRIRRVPVRLGGTNNPPSG